MNTPAAQERLRSLAGDRLGQYFEYFHLPENLQEFSAPFAEVAARMIERLPPSPERTVMLRKLLEAKDCAVRAGLDATTVHARPRTEPSER